MRVYACPKRHIAHGALQVIKLHDDVVAMRKPRGIPVVPTADNVAECVTSLAREVLNVDKVHVTSRLDAGTAGVLLLGLTSEGARKANGLLGSADCVKTYAVWTTAKPEKRAVRHWYNKRARKGRGIVKEELLREFVGGCPGEGWVKAELVVEEIEKRGKRWRSLVRLVTGRTHQIRMQFAANGWAVCGDCKYAKIDGFLIDAVEKGGELGPDAEAIGLTAVRVEGVLDGEKVVFETGDDGDEQEWGAVGDVDEDGNG